MGVGDERDYGSRSSLKHYERRVDRKPYHKIHHYSGCLSCISGIDS